MTAPRPNGRPPTKFEIVDDSIRELTSTGAGRKPEYDALMEGKTLQFPVDNATDAYSLANRIRNAMENRGKVVTARQLKNPDGTRNVIAWVTGDREVSA